jgi:hypothetical protein
MIRSLFIQTAAALFVFGMSTAVDATPDAERWNREFLEAKARKLDFEKRKTKGQTERAASERDRVRILNSRAKAEELSAKALEVYIKNRPKPVDNDVVEERREAQDQIYREKAEIARGLFVKARDQYLKKIPPFEIDGMEEYDMSQLAQEFPAPSKPSSDQK